MTAQVFSGRSGVPTRRGFRVGSDTEKRHVGHQSGCAAVRDVQKPVGPALSGHHRPTGRRQNFRGQQPVHQRPRQRGAKSDCGVDGAGRGRSDGGRREHSAQPQRYVRLARAAGSCGPTARQ